MKSSIAYSSEPRSIAIGDLNNDQQPDIVVANSGAHTIGILFGNSNGTFSKQKSYCVGSKSRPYSVVISNFNNDNYLDIAAANFDTNNIVIFLGNGNGTFTNQTNISLNSSSPLFLTTGDFNMDNKTDLAVVNYGTNNVGILLGNGDGSFQNQINYFTGYDSIPRSLAVGDFNHDNRSDLAVANSGTNNIGIFLGYGNGTFASQQTYTTLLNSNSSSIAVGDFNKDNELDILVANYGTGNIGLFLGHGNGSFRPQITYPIDTNSHPQHITVGYFDKNNELDVVIADSIDNRLFILLGYGNATFAPLVTYDMLSGARPYCVVTDDFNNNNQSDIIVANYGTSEVLVLFDYFSKPSARQKNYVTRPKSPAISIAVSDFNNDRILDLAFNAYNGIGIRLGIGDGTFNLVVTYLTNSEFLSSYICVGDLNNDNRMDIVSVGSNSNSAGVSLGHGDGSFDSMTNYSTGIGSDPWSVALGDVNNDNRLDIVTPNAGTRTVGIFIGNGDGTFAAMVEFLTDIASKPDSVALADINKDNHLDIILASWWGSVTIFLGYGNGTFIVEKTYSTGEDSTPISIALADFNRDNHLDIAFANTYEDSFGVFLGYGDGTFAPQTSYPTGFDSRPYYVITDDLNNDSIYDIVVANNGIDEVAVFYGNGNGSFELARTYPTGFGSKPYDLVVADLDDNKQLEIVVAFWGTGDIAVLTEYYAASFVNETIYSTGSAPQQYSVAVGDFNNDNRSDIVVANSGTDNLYILFGSGNGTFDTEIMYSIGPGFYPQYVITCHITEDSHLDIVTVNSKNNSISVIMGNGDGTFANQMIFSTEDGSNPYAVVCGDLNNDNRLDLVVANEGTDSVGIFYGFNYTSLITYGIYSSNYSLNPTRIVVHDFNNDNFLDIAAVFADSGSLGVLLGYGNGRFTDMMIYSTGDGSKPYDIAVGDFNNDGQSDIVVANSGIDNIVVLFGYGNGSFTNVNFFSTGEFSHPYAVAVADFNDDDRLDVAVVNRNTNSIGILLGYGNGNFSTMNEYSTGQGSDTQAITIGDFNNDDRLDIVVANYGTKTLGIFLNYGNGSFDTMMPYLTHNYADPNWVSVADFDGDNQLDIAISNWNSNDVGILLGYGNGNFSPYETYSTGSGSTPQCISVGDFNNDKILDIAAANSGTSDIVVLFGLGDGTFFLGTAYSAGSRSAPFALAIGDFNNDNRLDIVVTNQLTNRITVFLGYGSQPFAGVITQPTGILSQTHSVAVGDMNNDGRLDILVANFGTDNVGILFGNNKRNFDPIKTYLTENGSAPYSVAIANFNNDDYLDIVVTHSKTDNVVILLGIGNKSFANAGMYSTGLRSEPYTVATGYFNGDKILDIAVANAGTSSISLFHGYGNGTFGNKTSYWLGYGYHPYSIAVAYLNQDNWMDIVIACHDTDHVEILLSLC